MPQKNIIKTYAPNQYYHIYNRGVAKNHIFLEQKDKDYFLYLIDRYLNPDSIEQNSKQQNYLKFDNDLELLCYCLMDNHFHLLFWQHEDPRAISKLMKSLCTAYTMYFNKKYERVGHLFQSRYKASRISSDPHLLHISRYIHLNPTNYKNYKYSSYHAYLGQKSYPWLNTDKILKLFPEGDYTRYVESLLGLENAYDACG